MNEVYIKTKDLPKWLVDRYFDQEDLYTIENLIEIIEELDSNLEALAETFDDYKEYVQSNFKELSQAQQVE